MVRLLMLEDSEADAALIRRELQRLTPPPDVRHVQTEASFVAALREFVLDIIVCDHNIPSFGGWAALAIARQLAADVAFVLVTGALEADAAVVSSKGRG